MRRITVFMCAACAVVVVVCLATASVPRLINYQGVLTDDTGTPLTGSHDLTFTVYPNDGASPPVYWTETHVGVEVDAGLFNVILGGFVAIPDTLFGGGDRWMGITVDGGTEMSPRMQITSVPWALRAAVADTVLSGGGAGDGHSLDAADGDPVDALYVNDSGYVGIGTTDPMAQLDVRLDRDGAVSLAISNQSTGNNSKESLRFRDENGNSAHITAYDVNDPSWPGRLVVDNDRVGGSIWLRTNEADRLSILNNGNVGIGSVPGTEKLQVAGTVQSTSGGFKFPDGTVQTTADVGDEGLSLPYSDSTTVNYSAFIVNNKGASGNGIKGRNGTIGTEGFLGHSQYGVLGYGSSGAFAGVCGKNVNGNYGQLGGGNQGVYGQHVNGHYGSLATSDYGAYARNTNGNWGYLGGGASAAYGRNDNGNYGYLGGSSYAVAGYGDTVAVHGYNADIGNYGRLGTRDHGVYGRYTGGNTGTLGTADYGAYGAHANGNTGALGAVNQGATGAYANGNYGCLGGIDYGVYGAAPAGGYSGYFAGKVSAQDTVFAPTLDVAGTTRTGYLEIDGGADLAEPFDISDPGALDPGSVVVIDDAKTGALEISTESYDTRVAGVISGAGGIKAGLTLSQNGLAEDGQNVALSGRVYVRATASNGPIHPGDLLTTSPLAGHAMKATDTKRTHGAVLGKAMSALQSGEGLVLVLVSLQ